MGPNPPDQDKEVMIAELRLAIPVKGFNAQGQAVLLAESIRDLREHLGCGRPGGPYLLLDRVELA